MKFSAMFIILLAVLAIVEAGAVQADAAYKQVDCGRYTLYEFKGDKNTYRETIRVDNTNAEKVFYISTRYGNCKMKSAVVNCWDIVWADGEFEDFGTKVKLGHEANRLVAEIENTRN